MSTLTKEWLQSQISAIKAVGITESNTLQAFEIALASLEAEPVAPVSVPDAYVRDRHGRMMLNGRLEPRIGYSAGWNACRSAMLHGKE